MNNIYKVSQDINNGYDTYDSMIVIAKDVDEARKIHPDNYWDVEDWMDIYWVPYKDINKLEVELIGVTSKEVGVVLASFNAG